MRPLLLAVLSLTALVAHAKEKAVADEVRVDGAHLEQTSRCNKNGILRVLASDSHLLVGGDCTGVVVVGSRNWIQVEHADWIRMRGNLNTILYQDSRTRVDDRGRGNSVAPKWPQ